MRPLLSSFLLVLVLTHSVWPQSAQVKGDEIVGTGGEQEEAETDNIEDVGLGWTIRPFIATYLVDVDLKDDNGVGKKIEYTPNVLSNIGVGITYQNVGLSGSLAVGEPPKDTKTYGRTQYFDFQFSYYARNWGADLFLNDYDGYYLKNAADFDNPTVRRDDISVFTVGGNAYYKYEPHFSMLAAFEQSQRQLDHAGSPLIMVSPTYIRVSSNESLVPASQREFYPTVSEFNKGEFLTLSLLPGYGFTLVPGQLSFTIVAFLGLGMQYQVYQINGVQTTDTTLAVKFNGRASLWYDFKEEPLFLGTILAFDTNQIAFDQNDIDIRIGSWQLFLGFRIP